jgi:hypothetical protein
VITLVTVAGTVARWWEGYPADTARYLTEWQATWRELTGEPERFLWQGAEYPSATFPMRPSVLIGWEEVVSLLLNKHPTGKFTLSGYSQGALVVCLVWKHEILDPAGRLHHRLNDCLAVHTYGNPMRAPGIAYGNTLLWGRPAPGKEDGYTTGGIAGPADLRPEECVFPESHPQTGKPAVFDFANPGDLYAACPVGDDPWENESEVGASETLIYETVLDFNGGDLWSWFKVIFKTVTKPWTVWSRVQAIWNGIQFAKAGMNAPHWQYDIRPEITHLEQLGRQYG